jgi:4-hydroxy-tetrahydrodipicolinate reductase
MPDVVVAGAAGRMGRSLVACLQDTADLSLVGALERPGHPALGKDAGEVAGVGRRGVVISDDPGVFLTRDRILIEFSIPEATLGHLRLAAGTGARAVIGTTGFSPAEREEIGTLTRQIPILLSPNMSLAVNLAFKLLAQMAATLGNEYDVEITEIHHRGKKDAPSGTALRMAEIIASALGRDLNQVGVYGRRGLTGERTASEIGIQSLRAGDVVGEHTVVFGGLGERLELTHRVGSRDTFARGAIRAARFIATAPAGLYSMQDILGFK